VLTLLYDDRCGVSRSMAEFVRKRDRRRQITLVPLAASETTCAAGTWIRLPPGLRSI
jgi:predicted DCC family thiol-disulfide oxidoreductase YuxK